MDEGGCEVDVGRGLRDARARHDAGATHEQVDAGRPVVDVPLVHQDVELAELEAVVGRVEEVGAIGEAELLLHQVDDVRDQVVDRHERAPAVAEDAVRSVRRLFGEHRLRRHHARVGHDAARRCNSS